MNKEKALKNQGLEFREDIIMSGGRELAGLISKQLRNTLAVGLSGSRMMLMRY